MFKETISLKSSQNIVLIDGGFIHKVAAKVVGAEVDYVKLREALNEIGFSNIWFYNSVVYKNDADDLPAMRLFDFLATNGYMTEIDEYEADETKLGFDVKIAVRAMQASQWADNIMIVSASTGLVPLMTALQSSRSCTHLLTAWSGEAKTAGVCASMALRKASNYIYPIEKWLASLKKESKK